MGYNPYMCVICRKVEDNGWHNWSKIEKILINAEKTFDLTQDIFDGRHSMTFDVCDICVRKGPKVYDPFFKIKHTKEERRLHWGEKNKCIAKNVM